MIIHYNNGQEEKLITNVICITIVDGNTPATALLGNGKELTIRIDRIESILNDDIRSNNNDR